MPAYYFYQIFPANKALVIFTFKIILNPGPGARHYTNY